ncbi:MAG: hypothetical protein ACOCZV_00525 [Nanoarchaeota archaeon]
MVDLSPKCVKCGQSLDVNSMRTLPDGSFMCLSCYEQKISGQSPSGLRSPQQKPAGKPRKRPSEAADAVASEHEVFKEKEYICNDCGYKFRRNSEFVVSVCPYCGKNDVKLHEEPSADTLVDETQ